MWVLLWYLSLIVRHFSGGSGGWEKNKIRKRIHLSPTIPESRGSLIGDQPMIHEEIWYMVCNHNGYAHWTNNPMNPKGEIKDPGNMEASPYKKDFPPFLIMRSFQRASRQHLGKPTSTAMPAALIFRSCNAIKVGSPYYGDLPPYFQDPFSHLSDHENLVQWACPLWHLSHIPNPLMNH